MNESQIERFEQRVQTAAGTFAYPSTPDVAGTVGDRLRARQTERARRWQPRWAIAVIVVVLLAGLMAVPQVRAGVLEIIRIGVVRIFPQGLEGVPAPTQTPASTRQAPQTLREGRTATPEQWPTITPSSTPLPSVLDLAGQTTLEEAREIAEVPIRLPTYPPDLGQPDTVFVQQMEGTIVVLVWLEADDQEDVRMSLHVLTSDVFVGKSNPTLIRETIVNGQRALWTEGPYLLRVQGGTYDLIRLVDGHVLIWEENGITYRLETELPLEDAVRVAESLE